MGFFPGYAPCIPTVHLSTSAASLQRSLGLRVADFFPSYARRVLGWLAGSEDAEEAVMRLEHEPMFCVQTGGREGRRLSLSFWP